MSLLILGVYVPRAETFRSLAAEQVETICRAYVAIAGAAVDERDNGRIHMARYNAKHSRELIAAFGEKRTA